MYQFLKYDKEPEFIASKKPFVVNGQDIGWSEEEWYTEDIAIPKWWNHEYHAMVEVQAIAGRGLAKYCLRCDRRLSEDGCKHNM